MPFMFNDDRSKLTSDAPSGTDPRVTELVEDVSELDASVSELGEDVSSVTDRVLALETSIDASHLTGTLPYATYSKNYYPDNSDSISIPLEPDATYILVATHNATRGCNGIAIVPQQVRNVWVLAGMELISFSHTGSAVVATTTGGHPGYHMIRVS